jgi:3-phenylpropionate/trans-cinnamate dioxygenase ferredoxin reductase subunit
MGADGSITIVGREPHPPYHRPAVDKTYLHGTESRDDTLLRPPSWWRQNEIELLTGTSVIEIDPDERRARLSNDDEVRFSQALLATGATPRRLAVDGAGLDGIHSLGTLADADALRDELADAEHVVTVGGSYVACEAAASVRALGRSCTVVMLEDDPMQQAFGSTAAHFVRRALEMHGITVLGRDAVARYDGRAGHVRAVHTKAGRRLRADVVVVGVGVRPDTTLGRNTGLRIGDTGGLHCDASLRSSHPAVFGAGDACEYDSVIHRRRLRVELQHAAAEQGATAARNMLGDRQAHSAVPYCTAELADWVSLEYVGPAIEWEEELIRGSVADGEFTVWYLDRGRVVGALMVGRSQDVDHASSLIASRADLGEHRAGLTDPDSDLGLVSGARI